MHLVGLKAVSCSCAVIILLMASGAARADEHNPLAFLGIDAWPHASFLRGSDKADVDYLLGLGPMQKIRGQWAPEQSLRIDGRLQRATWMVRSGYQSVEGMAWIEEAIRAQSVYEVEEMFRCQRLKCGSSAEWANRIFNERVLYGPDRNQVYVALKLHNAQTSHYVILYAIQRSNMRQYLHADVMSASNVTRK